MTHVKTAAAARFVGQHPRAQKRSAGRTGVTATPLHVRAFGVSLGQEDREWILRRTVRQLGKLAPHIERISFRFSDVNGPRGGKDTVCKAKVVLSGIPSVVAEKRAKQPREAFDLVSAPLTRAVRRAVGRGAGRVGPAKKRGAERSRGPAAKRPPPTGAVAPLAAGSLIGRRVGQGSENLRRVQAHPGKERRDWPVDTAQPGVSASQRKVGATATATRNVKLRRRGMVAALEDSATSKPSRKSTRRSASRAKAASQLGRRTKRKLHSPKVRASRARSTHG